MTDQITGTIRYKLHNEFGKLRISWLGNDKDKYFWNHLSMWSFKYYDVNRLDDAITIIETGILDAKMKAKESKMLNENRRHYRFKYHITLVRPDIFHPKCLLSQITDH